MESEMCRTTMQAGTPAFQSPEQLKGKAIGVSTDVYALACIIVEKGQCGRVCQPIPPSATS